MTKLDEFSPHPYDEVGRVPVVLHHTPGEERAGVELVVQSLQGVLEVPGAGAPAGRRHVPAAEAFDQLQQGLAAAGLGRSVGVDAGAVVGLGLTFGLVGQLLRRRLCQQMERSRSRRGDWLNLPSPVSGATGALWG